MLAGRDEAAVGHLERAAEDARSVAAYAEAAGFLEQAARIAPERGSLLEELAEVEAWRGRREAALAAFEQAEAALPTPTRVSRRSPGSGEGAGCEARFATRASRQAGAYLRALELLDAAADPMPGALPEALAGLAWAEAVAGDARRSQELLDRLGQDPDPDPAAELDREVARGHLLIRIGRFADSYQPFTEAAELAQEIGRPDMSYACLINASVSAACSGDFERSLAFADKCRAIMREAGLAPLEANALAARCHILVRLGRLEEANASATAEAELAERLDDPALTAMADHDRGMACHAAGDHERAAELLSAALERDPPVSRPLARLARAESLVALGRLEEAEDELRATSLEPLGSGDFPDTLVARLARAQGLIALGARRLRAGNQAPRGGGANLATASRGGAARRPLHGGAGRLRPAAGPRSDRAAPRARTGGGRACGAPRDTTDHDPVGEGDARVRRQRPQRGAPGGGLEDPLRPRAVHRVVGGDGDHIGRRRRVHPPARGLSRGCRSPTASRCGTGRIGSPVISCLLHDFVYDWRLEPLDGGEATRISVHVAIPDEKVEDFEQFQRAMMGASVRRLAEVAAQSHQAA